MATGFRPEVTVPTPPPEESGAILDLDVDALATGGEGVARDATGRVVFLPRTAPGDRVRARVISSRKRWARAEVVELLKAGRGRRAAPCPVYELCGGCSLQHLDIRTQRDEKRRIVKETLRRIGRVDVELPEVAHAGPEFEYRNRIALTLRRAEEGACLGFRSRFDPGEVVDVDDCLIAEPAVRRGLADLRSFWGDDASNLPEGEELKVTIRSAADGAVAVHVEGGVQGRVGRPDVLAASVAGLVSYVHTDTGGDRTVLAGSGTFQDRWQGTRFDLGPGTFLQVNRAVSTAMDRQLDAFVGPRRGRHFADLYAGIGARALRWAREGARVNAVESDQEAVAAGRAAAVAEGLDVEFFGAPVESVPESYRDAEIIVMNPPRAGLSEQVCRRVAASTAARGLVYVSCDPATLARDLARLSTGWTPVSVRVFDAFPQTAHVETMIWLEPANRSQDRTERPSTEHA